MNRLVFPLPAVRLAHGVPCLQPVAYGSFAVGLAGRAFICVVHGRILRLLCSVVHPKFFGGLI